MNNLSVKNFTSEKIYISNFKQKILAYFCTSCANLKSFEQELAKLLDCKMMSIFLKHPAFSRPGFIIKLITFQFLLNCFDYKKKIN